MTLRLPSWILHFLWIFDLHDSSTSYVRLLEFHITLHLITTSMAHSSDVAETTHDTAWHDTIDMYWLTMMFVLSYCAAEWWYALSVTRLHLHMEKCAGSSMVLVFSWWCSCMFPFRLLLDVLHTFFQLRASLLACAPSSSHSSSRHVSSMYLFLQSVMMRWHQIQKSPSLTWCILFHFDASDRERDKALKLRRA